MATKQVKTWRVLRGGQRVGDSVREVGDLMPEASGFSNLRAYLNSHTLEEIWVDQSVIDEFYKELAERAEAVEEDDDDLDDPEGEDGEGSEGKVETEAPPVEAPKKKRVAKKAPAKKTTVKKKGKTNGRRLAEESV